MADIQIEAAAQTGFDSIAIRGGIFWTSPTVGYIIYVDGSVDLKYRKTSDGGGTWAAAVNIRTGSIICYDCCADWQVVDDAGTKIHIVYTDIVSDDVRYVYLDTSTDTVGGDDQIEAGQGTGAIKAFVGLGINQLSITKTRGGNLAVALRYEDSNDVAHYSFYTSPDATTWTSRASPWESDSDRILLFAGNEADNQDIWAIFHDVSTDRLTLKTYDDSGDSWSESAAFAVMFEAAFYLQMHGAIRFSDGHLILAHWSDYDSGTADLRVWDINGSGSISDTGDNVLTNSAETFLTSMFIDQSTDDIYVAYAKGGTVESTVTIYYKKSDDGGSTWGSETAMQADAADNERWISCGAMKEVWGGMFLPVWFNDDLDDLFCNTDNGISIAAAGVALEKALSDTVNISDALAMGVSLSKADTVNISDSIAKTAGLVNRERLAIADAIAKAISLVKADTVTINDSFDRVVAYVRALADTVTITDSISKRVNLIKTEAVAIADTIVKTVSLVKADAVAITDIIATVLGKRINLFDTVSITDHLEGVIRVKTYLKQAVDRMALRRLDVAQMPVEGLDIARMQVKGMEIARISRKAIDIALMSLKKMDITKTPVYRWIIRRWTA